MTQVLCILLLLLSIGSNEDKIKLEKSFVAEEIVNADQSSVWIETDLAGTIRIDRAKIFDIQTDKLFYIQFMNGYNTRGRVEFSDKKEVNVTGETGFTFTIPGEDLFKMTPIENFDSLEPSVTKIRAGALLKEKKVTKPKLRWIYIFS